MKILVSTTLLLACVASALFPTAALADGGSAGPLKYANGDVATATPKCGPGEICATIQLSNGDQIKVLTGGSGRCNPYVMTFMKYHNGQLDSVWSTPTDRSADSSSAFGGGTCGGFRNTHMLLDGGTVDMGIFQNKDGTVFVQFFTAAP
ncbi:MAG: hypothetical protein M3N13_02000 [Candidatus Eremiobacteraeota bacterium]|nr:hypothetical protein [Candidatus Eremiobacteraeota bacterium]